ncbi:MAG: hypothetical protein ACFE95_02895 [Candidatus Hodarchaeota archaeon]
MRNNVISYSRLVRKSDKNREVKNLKRMIILILISILFIMNVGSITLSPEGGKSASNVDFNSLDYTLDSTIQGEYEFSVTVEHNGSDAATAGSVPIPWEKVNYELPLTNGTGLLNESTVEYDLNGDGDIIDIFDVTWYNDTIRQWDAIIKDGPTDIRAYAITESPPGVFPNIKNYSINEKTKLFTLGSETHFLYRADNYTASFGLGEGYIYNHPGLNFELGLFSSKVNAIDFKINGDPVNVDFSTTVKHIGDYLVNSPTDAPVYVVPTDTFDINPGEQITFSCTIIAHEVTMLDILVVVNWSPDGTNRYSWVPVWDIISLEAINRPYFIPEDTSLTQVDSGAKQLTTTVKNIGTPAITDGKVPVIWEKLYYEFSLDNGEGTLDESITDYDINGDGDKDDTFDVSHEPSGNRPLDAIVGGVHVHSILDQPQSPWYNFTFFIEGTSKLFDLGSETHALYMADNEIAGFGLGAVLRNHPSPSFRLAYESQNIDASNFKINGETVEVDHEETFEIDVYYEENRRNFTVCIVPDQASEISSNEIVTFSCTFTAHETVTSEIVLRMDWSPDSNIRYRSGALFWQPDVEFKVPTSTTTTTTTTRQTAKTPGFTVLTVLVLLVPLLTQLRRRKGKKFL